MDLKKLTIREFDKAAERFDDKSPSVYNLCKKDYPPILMQLDQEPWESVLDAGCGTAALIELLSSEHPDKNYTGIDISENMIAVARKKDLKNARFVRGDCENLPFDDESFDAVVCSQSFHHYTDPQGFFDSVFRVLKPGGRLILRDMSTSFFPALWFFNHVEIPLINRLAHKGDVRVYNEKDIRAFCGESGLTLETFRYEWFCRMHCVCRKEK